MGTDIHSVVQVKSYGDDWQTVEHRLNGDPRSYDYFAILAGVRNGSGFAGIKTGDGYKPIAEPKGLPDDFAITEDQYHQGTWMGEHSYSWVTLEEMQQLDTGQRTKKCGVIPFWQYKLWREKRGWPSTWAGSVGGRNVRTVSIQEAEELIASGYQNRSLDEPSEYIYVQIEWEVSYGEIDPYQRAIDRMQTIANHFHVKPNAIRLVFGFDS